MKVLHLSKYFLPHTGGMETYLRDLMAAQARQNLDVEALVHQSATGFHTETGSYPVGDQQLPITRAAVWATLLFTPISPIFPWLLRRILKRTQPDILHLHMPNPSVFWVLLLPRAKNIPWVIQWHADVPASRHSLGLRVFHRVYHLLERAMLKRCQAIIASSPPYLASSVPLREFREKSHVIPLGLDPARLPPPGQRQTSQQTINSPLRILAVGRLTYYKGFEYLIRAAKRCASAEIHLVGEGDQEPKLRALVRELDLDNRVFFHGRLPDTQLAQQFAQCDCLCLPSIERTEAFGMVLLEAMYCGKATLVSNVPGSGMGWVVDDGITGLHVPPENIDALADSMRKLHQNRDRIAHLGKNGRQRFDRLFHIDKSASGVSELYELVLRTATGNQ